MPVSDFRPPPLPYRNTARPIAPPPIAFAAVCAMAGAALSAAADNPVAPREWLWGALGMLCCTALAAPRRAQLAGLCLCLAVGMLGAARVSGQRQIAEAALGARAPVVGEVLRLQGARALVATDNGPVRVIFSEPRPKVGDRIAALTVAPEPDPRLPGLPPDNLADHISGAPLRRARRALQLGGPPTAGLDRPDPFAAAEHGPLLKALLSGDRATVPKEQIDLLRRTGTSHLMSVSGLHVALIGGMWSATSSLLLRPQLRRQGSGLLRLLPLTVGLLGSLAFASSVGMPISAQRAVWMGGCAALALALGRRPNTAALLSIAALAVLLWDPSAMGEPSAWLSFGAVAGMVGLGPQLTRYLPTDPPPGLRPVVQSVAATLGASVGTLPASALVFQEVPPISPIANLWAGPPISVAVMPLVALVPVLPAQAAEWLLIIADNVLGVVLDGLRALPEPRWRPSTDGLGALALSIGLLFLRRKPSVTAIAALLALGLRTLPHRELEVWFLSIGQGDAALLRFPDGRRWLVDAGPPSRQLVRWLRMHGDTELDAVFLSHPHPDHQGGMLPVLEELKVGALWVPRPPTHGEEAYQELWRAAFAAGVPVRLPGAEGPTVLHPADGWRGRGEAHVNDESLVLHVRFGERTLLFAGDVEARAEAHLGLTLPTADVVKVPHHGSRTSSTPAFVGPLRASFAVISCGRDNRYGHPHAEALARWRGVRVLRTDLDGTVVLRTDGRSLRWSGWTPEHGWRPIERAAWAPQPGPLHRAAAALHAEDHWARAQRYLAEERGEAPPRKSKGTKKAKNKKKKGKKKKKAKKKGGKGSAAG